MPRRIGAFVFAALLVCAPAHAQDPAELVSQGEAFVRSAQYPKAIETLERVPESAEPIVRLRKHVWLAEALRRVGRLDRVEGHIAEAERLAAQVADPPARVRVAITRGSHFRDLGQKAASIAALKAVLTAAEASGDRVLLSDAYGALSDSFKDLESWEDVVFYAQKMFELLEHPPLVERYRHAVAAGIGYYELFDRNRAEQWLLESLAIAHQMQDDRRIANSTLELALLYETFDRDFPRALRMYDEAIAIGTRVHDVDAGAINNRGALLRTIGDYGRAMRAFRDALDIEKRHSSTRLTFMVTKNIGQLFRLMGRHAEALAILDPLVRNAAAGDVSPRLLWQAHMELASTYDALGRPGDAQQEYRATLNALEEQRNTSLLDAFRTGSLAHSINAYDPYERYLRFLSAGPMTESAAAESFHVAERARARAFLEMLGTVRSAVAETLPPAVFAEEAAIQQAITGLQRQLRAPDLPRARRDALLADLAAREQDRERLILKLRFEHPAVAHARYPDVAVLGDLQSHLGRDETLLAYFLGEQTSFRWVVSRSAVEFRRLPDRHTIEEQARRLRDVIGAPGERSNADREAARLAAVILDGVTLPPRSHLIVVPYGALYYVPFELLPIGDRMIVEEHAVSYAPSFNSFVWLRQQRHSGRPFKVLAVGDPEMQPRSAQSTQSQDFSAVALSRAAEPDTAALLGPLPYTRQEIDRIGRRFRWQHLTLAAGEARESRIKSLPLADFRIVHFATHGLVNELHPTRSALVFSPERGEDGLLQVPEIYKLPLAADLVVLSACQTALGKQMTGEGIEGLTRAFAFAGASSVVASLWNLNDQFAADFMDRFYDGLRRGHPIAEALQQAKVYYLHHPEHAHPFFWSAFVLTGDGERVVYAASDDPTRMLGAAAVLTGVVLLALALLVRRRNPVGAQQA